MKALAHMQADDETYAVPLQRAKRPQLTANFPAWDFEAARAKKARGDNNDYDDNNNNKKRIGIIQFA